jgi:hypothetical protein
VAKEKQLVSQSRNHQTMMQVDVVTPAFPRAAKNSPRERNLRHTKRFTELSLVIPILLVIAFGAVDLGRMFFYYIEMTNAVRAGAVIAAQEPSNSAEINDTVLKHGSHVPALTTLAITCTSGTCASAKSGDDVTIKATWNFDPLPWDFFDRIWKVDPVVMSTQATMKVL